MLSRVGSNSGPLTDLVVLEVSARAAGAYCGRLLSLLGATVVRVEAPLVLDVPAALDDIVANSLNRGKQTVEFDSADLAEIARRCSVVVVDSRDDDAADGKFTAITRAVQEICPPRTPVVDLGGLRQTLDNTAAAVPFAPIIATAASGLAWGIGSPDSEPLSLPFDLADYLTGTEGAAAAALALLRSVGEVDDVGQHWDVTAADVLSYYVGQIGSNFLPYDRPWRRDGPRATLSGGSYPAAMFPCQDGWVSIMCRTQREYDGLLDGLGRPEWTRSAKFTDPRVVARLHADEADKHLTAWTSARTRDEVFAVGRQYGFPVAPVLTIAESLSEEQFAHRGFFESGPNQMVLPGSPYHLYRTEASEKDRTRVSGWPAAEAQSSKQPLAGLRVLDLSWVWSGPMVTATLRDLGAEVVKVEHRSRADPARLRGRALRNGVPVEGPELEVTPYFNQLNRAKRSVAIDMGSTEGAALIGRLAAESDVVVENMRPGVLARRGLDYESLSQTNPGLVMVSMSMLGQTGPLSGIRGYAPVMSGLAGLDSLVGYDSDRLIGTYNPALGDPNGAGHALVALLSALVGRQRTGQGCYIDLSQVEALLSVLTGPIIQTQVDGHVPVPANRHQRLPLHGTFACAGTDNWVSIAARTERELSAVGAVVNAPHTASSSSITALVREWTVDRDADAVANVMRAQGVPAARVVGYEEALFGERASERGVGTVTSHRWLGEQMVVTVPWKVDGHGFTAGGAAPQLGEDTEAVLAEVLALRAADLAELRQRAVIE
ncbi:MULTISPECIES: CaiB/BaiF CoA-transferase family protein [Rhodococcus]|uniref:L-carnitine dehydratase/bile acid-inducible protein F n=1 Tax=Rhodococcus opacus RKJ300 = JCM 13270 TaxID=1165867 RepID=I0WKR7_RHOOP|nr:MULTISPECIES: CoA transferase [Rhodococcus]EID76983.1 L-carnitine dehydratase/bile acid-inducible protein F [Rhodococcus opacus RKJ300 = JCM 13270]QQZ19301.1 CoA transferase [Rhodococcus sp. 21391]